MSIFPIAKHRRFTYQSSTKKNESSGRKIEFRRLSSFDPHTSTGTPKLLIALLAAILGIIYLLGGFKPSSKPPTLSSDDAVVRK